MPSSFIVSDSYVDAAILQLRRYSLDIRLSVVVGEEHLGLDGLGSFDELFCRHRVWLVAGHEGDIDVFDGLHLWDVLRIASDVDAQAVDGQDVAVVASFRVELCTSLCGVIGGHGLYRDVFECRLLTIAHDLAITQHVCTALVGNQLRLVASQLLDSLLVEVVAMLVGDEDVVGLGHRTIVYRLVA